MYKSITAEVSSSDVPWTELTVHVNISSSTTDRHSLVITLTNQEAHFNLLYLICVIELPLFTAVFKIFLCRWLSFYAFIICFNLQNDVTCIVVSFWKNRKNVAVSFFSLFITLYLWLEVLYSIMLYCPCPLNSYPCD